MSRDARCRAAKLGVLVQAQGSDDAHEVAYVMTDTDDTDGRVAAAYADIRLVRPPRPGPSLAAAAASPAPGRPSDARQGRSP